MEIQSPTPYEILECSHRQKHEIVDAAASVRRASDLRPSVLLYQRYGTKTPLYQNVHCGLVVGDTGKERYSRMILQDNNMLIDV